VDCITGACDGYGPPRVYVQATVREKFPTLVKYPGVASPILGRVAYYRAQ